MVQSLQDILKRRQQEEFVGREEQLIFFRHNLRYEPDDDRRRFVISISGQGGVGKTWLLRRFRKIAEEFAAVTAFTDEAEDDVPGVMGCIAEQFDAQGHALKTFAERYKVYRHRRQEIEADPDAPQGFPAFLGRTLAKGGLRLARRVPVGGVAADFVDEEAFASLAGDFASYVARKIGNRDEVRLVLEPVEVLTPLFLADLQRVAKEHPLALFCDTYERTGGFLDSWLRDLLEGRHGDVPVNIVLTIAGRDELDRNHWAPYEGLLARLPLEPFTEEEAHDYLARKGITDEQVAEVILGLSGRLPLLVATLAAESPDDPARVGDPSGEAVERFLKWVEDPEQRQVALDAALPRRLNRDVLVVLVGEKEADNLFTWLRGMPFVEKRSDGWAYHDVVRAQMLRYKRQEAPKGWADLHGRLAEYYEKLRADLGLEEAAGRKDETWQRQTLESLYHRLCQSPQKHFPTALNNSLFAQASEAPFFRRWAETIRVAGVDTDTDNVRVWGRRLVVGVGALQEGHHQAVVEMFTALLDAEMLTEDRRVAALAGRGVMNMRMGEYTAALTDFEGALESDPDFAWAIAGRGATYRRIGEYAKALADLNRAIELDPDNVDFITSLGTTYRLMGELAAALTSLNQGIELEPNNVWATASRGLTYLQMREYAAALADFNRAVELSEETPWFLRSRGECHRQMGQDQQALEAFNKAINLDQDDMWAIARRGLVYSSLKEYRQALADFNRAMEIQPELPWAIAARGEVYQAMGQLDPALADFDLAISLDSDNPFLLTCRAGLYFEKGQHEQALADVQRAIALDETLAPATELRERILRQLSQRNTSEKAP